ncbi:hypothetical protein DFH09DRAFT_1277334 [Mycena vulgaris]|nr:hypothetical protein DFH09DRAFT_1277334 [Mycena vulgaris]
MQLKRSKKKSRWLIYWMRRTARELIDARKESLLPPTGVTEDEAEDVENNESETLDGSGDEVDEEGETGVEDEDSGNEVDNEEGGGWKEEDEPVVVAEKKPEADVAELGTVVDDRDVTFPVGELETEEGSELETGGWVDERGTEMEVRNVAVPTEETADGDDDKESDVLESGGGWVKEADTDEENAGIEDEEGGDKLENEEEEPMLVAEAEPEAGSRESGDMGAGTVVIEEAVTDNEPEVLDSGGGEVKEAEIDEAGVEAEEPTLLEGPDADGADVAGDWVDETNTEVAIEAELDVVELKKEVKDGEKEMMLVPEDEGPDEADVGGGAIDVELALLLGEVEIPDDVSDLEDDICECWIEVALPVVEMEDCAEVEDEIGGGWIEEKEAVPLVKDFEDETDVDVDEGWTADRDDPLEVEVTEVNNDENEDENEAGTLDVTVTEPMVILAEDEEETCGQSTNARLSGPLCSKIDSSRTIDNFTQIRILWRNGLPPVKDPVELGIIQDSPILEAESEEDGIIMSILMMVHDGPAEVVLYIKTGAQGSPGAVLVFPGLLLAVAMIDVGRSSDTRVKFQLQLHAEL